MIILQNEPVRGCVPAMGYSFASGTIDGANTLNITQVGKHKISKSAGHFP